MKPNTPLAIAYELLNFRAKRKGLKLRAVERRRLAEELLAHPIHGPAVQREAERRAAAIERFKNDTVLNALFAEEYSH